MSKAGDDFSGEAVERSQVRGDQSRTEEHPGADTDDEDTDEETEESKDDVTGKEGEQKNEAEAGEEKEAEEIEENDGTEVTSWLTFNLISKDRH